VATLISFVNILLIYIIQVFIHSVLRLQSKKFLEQGTSINDFRSKKILNQKSLIIVRYSKKNVQTLLKKTTGFDEQKFKY